MKLTSELRPSLRPVGLLQRLSTQIILSALIAVILPLFVSAALLSDARGTIPSLQSSIVGTTLAVVLGIYMFRRFDIFPGVRRFAYVIPSFVTSFGIVLAIFFFLRLDYSRLLFGLSFAAITMLYLVICRQSRRVVNQRFYVVPFGNVGWLRTNKDVDAVFLQETIFPREPNAVLVADLRADIPDDWDRMIAETAIAGFPVYHTKQLQESIEGSVQIEHLSENSFGSLVPNLNYRNVKRIFDLTGALLTLPGFVLITLIVAPFIKLSSPGPIFFRQTRVGYRGELFKVVKFRTMRQVRNGTSDEEQRRAAMTQCEDNRVTPIGRLLRRSRIDELPQILNVLRGEMSWIGPRPEAVPLAHWYGQELPFYAYRHIVRPGITGWAQVNQGHVAELHDVQHKLHYDFYYIKYFSAWLDLLIVMRTAIIMLTGFGSK